MWTDKLTVGGERHDEARHRFAKFDECAYNFYWNQLLVGLYNHWCSIIEYLQKIYFFKSNEQCEIVSNA